jgi:hypothetical protein
VDSFTYRPKIRTCKAGCTVEPDSKVQINDNSEISFLCARRSEKNIIDTDISMENRGIPQVFVAYERGAFVKQYCATTACNSPVIASRKAIKSPLRDLNLCMGLPYASRVIRLQVRSRNFESEYPRRSDIHPPSWYAIICPTPRRPLAALKNSTSDIRLLDLQPSFTSRIFPSASCTRQQHVPHPRIARRKNWGLALQISYAIVSPAASTVRSRRFPSSQ